MPTNKPPVNIGPNSGLLNDFYKHIGEALMMWQRVEVAHYKLFLQILSAPSEEVAALTYFSQESFNNRHVMVGYMVQTVLRGRPKKQLRSEWGGLQKAIKDANEERNKLAHYTVNIEVAEQTRRHDGIVAVILTDPLLQPLAHNAVSRIQGKTPDNVRHSLDVASLAKQAVTFYDLSQKIDSFRDHVRWAMHPTCA